MTVRTRRWKGKDGCTRESFEVDVKFVHADGRVQRVKKRSPVQTRRGAERYERELRQSLLEGTYAEETKVASAMPTVADFGAKFLAWSKTNNKPSTFYAKKRILEAHLLPAFGKLALDKLGPFEIEEFKGKKLDDELSKKTINNMLTVLGRLLNLAVEWGVLQKIPPIRWMKAPKPQFDFLSFEEAELFVSAADGEWRTMILVALNTGLRRGELMALQWDDLDLVAGRMVVRRNMWMNQIGTPKGGRSREIPLNDTALQSLKAHRHLRSQLVFCKENGKPLSNVMCRERS